MNRISITTLGDLVEFQRGYDLPKSEFRSGNVPVISSNGILGYHNHAKVKGPGITIGRSGTVGLPHYIDQDFFPHNTALFIKDFKGNHPKYIYYLLKTLSLNNRGTGSGVPTMNRNHLHPIKVSAHLDFNYQQNIAKILSDIDAKIELNNRINAQLEAMAKLIYDYWFVQFDFPYKKAGTEALEGPYKSSGGKMVWNKELKREIPEGWEVKSIEVLTSFISRGISPRYLDEGGICVLNQKCIRNRTVSFNESRRCENNLSNSSSKHISKYDILVNSTGVGTLGRVAIVNYLTNELITVDSHVTIIRANEQLIGKLYFGFSLLEKQKEIERLALGSTGQVELSRTELESLKLIVPSKKLQENFKKIYKNCLDRMAANSQQNQHLTSLRDWLLPMLMNGQVRVREDEKPVSSMAAEERGEYSGKRFK